MVQNQNLFLELKLTYPKLLESNLIYPFMLEFPVNLVTLILEYAGMCVPNLKFLSVFYIVMLRQGEL